MNNSNSQSVNVPQDFSQMSDYDLFHSFTRDNWVRLDESARMSLLSEVVNRENARYGANYSVQLEFKNMKSNVSGYQRGENIFLNREMFVNDRAVEMYNGRQIVFNIEDSNWQALETVLHENRHVLQDKIAAGEVKCDDATRALFASNGFDVSYIDGQRACQYMLGENGYEFYYLNPTELDAFKTSQDKTQSIINALSRYGMDDASAEKYIESLAKCGYQVKLDEFRSEFNNPNVDKEVAQVLQNVYFNTDVPVDRNIEQAVKAEMIESQYKIDNPKNMETQNMSKTEIQENGYIFTVDDSGTITAVGKVPTQGVKCGSRVTPEGMIPGDQRGHVIAAQQGGPNAQYNMTAQDGKLNQGPYKTAENAEVDLARKGYDVETSKTAYVSTQEGGRPDAYMINDTITSPDGKTQSVHLSFQNMSPEMQDAQNQEVAGMNISDDYPNPDPLRDSMTTDEYTALMDETEASLPSVKDEFDIPFSEDYGAEANSCMDEGASTDAGGASTDGGVSGGADGGADGGVDI